MKFTSPTLPQNSDFTLKSCVEKRLLFRQYVCREADLQTGLPEIGFGKTSGELEEICLLGGSSVKPPQFSWGIEGGRLKLHPLWLPPFISSFCNWMHVSITEYYCPFSSYSLRDTQGLGRLRAPPQWNCKWRPAELLWQGAGRRAPQLLGAYRILLKTPNHFSAQG